MNYDELFLLWIGEQNDINKAAANDGKKCTNRELERSGGNTRNRQGITADVSIGTSTIKSAKIIQ